MLLGYEYKDLLADQSHAAEVASILEELDFDCIIAPEGEQHRAALLDRLKELGEHRILQRLTQN
jgi:hypothetical protein